MLSASETGSKPAMFSGTRDLHFMRIWIKPESFKGSTSGFFPSSQKFKEASKTFLYISEEATVCRPSRKNPGTRAVWPRACPQPAGWPGPGPRVLPPSWREDLCALVTGGSFQQLSSLHSFLNEWLNQRKFLEPKKPLLLSPQARRC